MDSIAIGALVPLSPPGWAEAGRHLLAGLELGVRDVDVAFELLVRDTAGDPERAAAAVDELARLGVAAVVGEYHSVVARAVAARANALGLPFLCSSAVLDALTDEPTDWVARLAPPQSRGWRVFADFLRRAGHSRVAVVAGPGVYWASGVHILRERLDVRMPAGDAVCDELASSGATALLLLVGHPEPASSIVKAVRADPRVADVLIGAPAGQPEFSEWATLGAAIPFLRYLPDRLTPLGVRVEAALRQRLGGAPSFVAFEGYDAAVVLAAALRSADLWAEVAVEGTRGRIAFSRTASVWQWTDAPIQVVDRDPDALDRFRIRCHADSPASASTAANDATAVTLT